MRVNAFDETCPHLRSNEQYRFGAAHAIKPGGSIRQYLYLFVEGAAAPRCPADQPQTRQHHGVGICLGDSLNVQTG